MNLKAFLSIIVAILMGVSAYFGSLTYQCLQLSLAFAFPKAFRWYIDVTMFMWICSSISLLEWIIGVKFRIYGDKINANERALIIMNHRSRLDWLYFYGILMRFGSSLRDEKIVLKNELKRIPGPGWAMQCAGYIFMERKLEIDKLHLSNMIEYFSSVDHNTKILLFPEGTDLSDYSKERSNSYADKMGLPKYENVLHPRTAGFIHLTEEMIRCFEDFDAIYDVTSAYPDKNFACNELQFIMGRASTEVHFLCRRYSLKEILKTDNPIMESVNMKNLFKEEETEEKLKTFINKLWNDKEKMLTEYYQKKENKPSSFQSVEVEMDSVLFKQMISVFLICGNIFTCIYALFIIPKVSLPIFFILNAIFIYVDIFQDGVDELVLKLTLKDKYRSFTKRWISQMKKHSNDGIIKEE